jgi:3(or 17)beta-hydroxysteroid dehydrogenase
MERVKGKVVLVTGGASGLGEADAIMLAAEGARVVISDVNEDAGRALAKKIDGQFVRHDVRSEDDWKAAIAHTIASYGKLDVLINNAGIAIVADIEETTLEQFKLIQAIHTEGTFLGCKYGVAAMKSHGGSIINISSMSALRAYPIFLSYSTAKGAIRAMSRAVAAHCQDKGYGIRCNTIFPGVINTPLVTAAIGGDYPGAGKPSDVANMVVYLASDESSYVTGAEFLVDNGSSLRAGSAAS